jgi:hypothetical protein
MHYALFAQASGSGLRTTPEIVGWAHLVPYAAAAVIAVAVGLTLFMLPKVLKGGFAGPAMLRQLMTSNDNAGSPAGGPVLESLNGSPAAPGDQSQTPPGSVPTWAGMDMSIFDDDDPVNNALTDLYQVEGPQHPS